METLGHSQISLTLNTYSHVLPALQDAAALKMDVALGWIATEGDSAMACVLCSNPKGQSGSHAGQVAACPRPHGVGQTENPARP